jgi:hypothetical protein
MVLQADSNRGSMMTDGEKSSLQNSEDGKTLLSVDGSSTKEDSASSAIVGRSTGPRTQLGKQRSKHNARKHGIFSSAVVLEGESRRNTMPY